MATEPTYRCGTCGNRDINVESNFYAMEWLSESEGITHFEPTGDGDMSIKCNHCGRSVSVAFSKHPSKIFPTQSGAFSRMMTVFEGRSCPSKWAKCITGYSIPRQKEN